MMITDCIRSRVGVLLVLGLIWTNAAFGDGPLFPVAQYAADDASASIAIGDLNGDQVLDLAVANRGTCAPRSRTLLRRLGDDLGRCRSGRGNGTPRRATFTGAYLEHFRCETLEASLVLPGAGAQRTAAINPRPCTP